MLATQTSLAPAEKVQHAGTRYVETVATLVTLLDSVSADTGQQGREAAMSALRGAAEQVARLPGHDDRTEQLLLELRALRQR